MQINAFGRLNVFLSILFISATVFWAPPSYATMRGPSNVIDTADPVPCTVNQCCNKLLCKDQVVAYPNWICPCLSPQPPPNPTPPKLCTQDPCCSTAGKYIDTIQGSRPRCFHEIGVLYCSCPPSPPSPQPPPNPTPPKLCTQDPCCSTGKYIDTIQRSRPRCFHEIGVLYCGCPPSPPSPPPPSLPLAPPLPRISPSPFPPRPISNPCVIDPCCNYNYNKSSAISCFRHACDPCPTCPPCPQYCPCVSSSSSPYPPPPTQIVCIDSLTGKPCSSPSPPSSPPLPLPCVSGKPCSSVPQATRPCCPQVNPLLSKNNSQVLVPCNNDCEVLRG